MNVVNKVLKSVVILPIKLYQLLISPILGSNCKYQPTCSQYMIGSIEKWGIIHGFFLGIKRILRCHPWSKGGYDPVPEKSDCCEN